MEIKNNVQARNDLFMKGMDVTVEGNIVKVSEGTFIYDEQEFLLKEIEFKLDSTEPKTYDLYITRSVSGIEYDLIVTPIEDIAFYNGSNELIHTYVSVRTDQMKATVNRVIRDSGRRILLDDKTQPSDSKINDG